MVRKRDLILLASATWAGLTTLVAGHSHIPYIIINGEMFPGFQAKILENPPNVVGWSAQNPDDGFISPANYTSPDIICHNSATPAAAHAPVRAGDRIHVQWNGWPKSHVGPIMSYLARCPESSPSGCAKANKTELEFFKIDDGGPVLLKQEGEPPGLWATDVLIASNNSWLVEIPKNTAPGPYVFRHELIALHYARQRGGAQNYPQCINLWVLARQGNGDDARAANLSWSPQAVGFGKGSKATEMYRSYNPGIEVDVYRPLSTYQIPGPTLVSGAAPVPLTQQAKSVPTAWGTPVMVVDRTSTVPAPVTRKFVRP